jgi:hypothetical protein
MALCITSEDSRQQPWLKRFNLSARIAQARDLDHGRRLRAVVAHHLGEQEDQCRALSHFPNGAGSHTEAAYAQLVEQLFLYEVHLPQIWRV